MRSGATRPSISQAAIAAVVAVLVAAALFPFTAKLQPGSWDELVYIGAAFSHEPQPWRLNRYAHIYALVPFIELSGDPFVGARLFWSCAVGLLAGMLSYVALSGRNAWTALALTLIFFVGQEDLFRAAGVAFAEYTAAVAVTAAFCLLWTRLARAAPLAPRHAALVGLFSFVALKSTEVALPCVVLLGVFVISPEGRLRLERDTVRLFGWSIGGIAAGMLGLALLDLTVLGDPLFSVRPSTWRALLAYNTSSVQYDADYVARRWVLRPENLRALAVYASAGLLWFRAESDARLRFLYAVPLAFIAELGVAEMLGRLDFVPRYVVPALPLLAFVPAAALARALADARPKTTWRRAVASGVAAIVVVFATGIVAHLLGGADSVRADRLQRAAATGLVLAACAGIIAARRRPRLLAGVAVPVLVAACVLPLWRTGAGLARRDAQRAADAWFGGFYEVARTAAIPPQATIFVSEHLYGGQLRPPMLRTLAALNFNQPLPRERFLQGADVPPAADYAVLSAAEYEARRADGGTPSDAIVSSDGQVALVCLRTPCARVR